MYTDPFGTVADVYKNAVIKADARAKMIIYLLENKLLKS